MDLLQQWNVAQRGPKDAPPVLFLHGFLGRGADWSPILDGIDTRFRCITVDLPGHGAHVLAPDQDLDELRAQFPALLDQLAVDRVALVGYSMGGRLALWWAVQAPGRVRALVLESSQPGIRDEATRITRQEQDGGLADRLEAMAGQPDRFREFLDDWYRLPLFESIQSRPDLLAKVTAQRMENDPVQLARATRLIGGGALPPVWDALEQLTIPTLCITGEEDRKYCGIAEEMSGISPEIAVQTLENCGHNVHLENPDGYTRVLQRFLDAAQRNDA